jgi:hypothetical protein
MLLERKTFTDDEMMYLVRAAQRGDPDSFTLMFEFHYPGMLAVAHRILGPGPGPVRPRNPRPARSRTQATITECDAKIARYRAVLDAGGDPALVTTWITQTQAERLRAQAELDRHTGSTTHRRLSRDQIADLVHGLGDMIAVLHEADPADKAEVYKQLGLRLTYHPDTETVHAQADLGLHRWEIDRVRGGR